MRYKAIYIGDFKKLNGPSQVDVSLLKFLTREVAPFQSTNRNIVKLLVLITRSKRVHVSGLSFIGLLAILISKLLMKKSSYTMHGSLRFESISKEVPIHRLLIEKAILFFSDEIIVVSSLMLRFVKVYKDKVKIIPNGFEKKIATKADKDNTLIVAIGGGRKEKGVLNLAKAIESLNLSVIKEKKLKLIVFGEDGPDTVKIKSFDCVDYRGFSPYKEVQSELLRANIFASCSIFESFSLAIVEAIESSCKILTFEDAGVIDYIPPSEGLEIIKSPKEIQISIIKLINSELNLKIKHNVPSWDNVALLYLDMWGK